MDLGKAKLQDKIDERRVDVILLQTAKERLEEEKKQENPNQERVDEWEKYIKAIMGKAVGKDASADAPVVVNGGSAQHDGGVRADGGSDDITEGMMLLQRLCEGKGRSQ